MLLCGPTLPQVLKVAILAEKYAVDYSWYVDTILNLIRIAGDYVSEEVWYRVLQIVTNRDDVQGYAAKTVFEVSVPPPDPRMGRRHSGHPPAFLLHGCALCAVLLPPHRQGTQTMAAPPTGRCWQFQLPPRPSPQSPQPHSHGLPPAWPLPDSCLLASGPVQSLCMSFSRRSRPQPVTRTW